MFEIQPTLFLKCLLIFAEFLPPSSCRHISYKENNVYFVLIAAFFTVSVIAEDKIIKGILDAHEIPCQTPAEADPIRILPAKCLGKIYNELGKCVYFCMQLSYL